VPNWLMVLEYGLAAAAALVVFSRSRRRALAAPTVEPVS
jgi:hypothetical protein